SRWNPAARPRYPSSTPGLSSAAVDCEEAAHDRSKDDARDVPVRAFERIAAAVPTAIALEYDGVLTTYAELDARANRLAHDLGARGVTEEAAVAVCLPTSPDAIVAMLAIWKAGGVYVPLDPSHPKARLQTILDDTGARCLMTREGVAAAAGLACEQSL